MSGKDSSRKRNWQCRSHLPEYLKDFILFAYITGMRRGEVQSLRWSDIHGDAITLRPENSKNSEARTIPLEGELGELIERRREARKVKKEDGTISLPNTSSTWANRSPLSVRHGQRLVFGGSRHAGLPEVQRSS